MSPPNPIWKFEFVIHIIHWAEVSFTLDASPDATLAFIGEIRDKQACASTEAEEQPVVLSWMCGPGEAGNEPPTQ